MVVIKYSDLYKEIGYSFIKKENLQRSLTHASFSVNNNQRMEFLGDSLLNFIVSDLLYFDFPDCDEGVLTRARAYLVKKSTHVYIAKKINLGHYLRVDIKSFPDRKNLPDRLLADGFEALVAAVYLDAGIKTCGEVFVKLYKKHMQNFLLSNFAKDAKTRLQEFCQSSSIALPKYEVLQESIASKGAKFEVQVSINLDKEIYASAVAKTKRCAEIEAAENLLHKLKVS